MNTFTIKDIENLTGIKAHTLRIWEQRYQLLLPKRKDTNHRIYDNEDLKALLRVAYLYHSGVKISKIATMSESDIKRMTLDTQDGNNFYMQQINQLIEATIEFDQLRFEKIFHNALLHIGFEKCVTRVIYPYLHKIGLLWLTGNVIPAQEHFASTIIRSKLIVAIDGLDIPYESADHYLTFLPEGELHEIPLLYIQYLLKKNGKQVTSLGPNVPMADIDYFVQYKRPSHLLTYLMTSISKPDLDGYISVLTNLRKESKVIVMGPVTEQMRHFEGIAVLQSLEALEEYMRRS